MIRNLFYSVAGLTLMICLISCQGPGKSERILLSNKVITLPEGWKDKFKDAQKSEISDTIGTAESYVQVEASIITSGDSHFISQASLYSVGTGSTEIKASFNGMPLNRGDKQKISMFLTGNVFFYTDKGFSKKMTGRSFIINSNGSIEKKP
ncbi:hypothetical protein L1276_004918 [Flavobacterium sp. HSC-32F16]|uniref:hypothetical protein n=1 Tax=Flavobacterium sp. HSC-32F16 TaxID=2910964 RepID=UPI0020A31661|nr:hypothetical protein [Flavobacterium sp. HSC-32F16]MCP2029724.1 hypothetical protein [Flavobacterium sp. HSC-32F16]